MRRDDGTQVTMRGLQGANIPNTRREPPAGATSVTKTRTLRGMGPTEPPIGKCSCCHVRSEQEHSHPIDGGIAVAFGIALVFVRGVDAVKSDLCPKHTSMVRALVNEIRNPSNGE